MKKFYLTLLSIALIQSAYAQSNFFNYSAGVGLGATYTFTDVDNGNLALAYQGTFDYYFTPFITGGVELQMGKAKGGNARTEEHLREFTTDYKAYMLNAKVRLGQFTDFYSSDFLNLMKGTYVGAGVGFMQSKIDNIVRTKPRPDGSIYTFPGVDKSSGTILPINLGIDFSIPDSNQDERYVINVNYQTNYLFTDDFDGYNDPKNLFNNKSKDMYTFFSIGFKYAF